VAIGIWGEYDEDKKFGKMQPKDILEWMDKQGFISDNLHIGLV